MKNICPFTHENRRFFTWDSVKEWYMTLNQSATFWVNKILTGTHNVLANSSCNKITTNWVACKQQILISHNSETGNSRSRLRQIQFWVKTCFYWQLSSHCDSMAKGMGCSMGSFTRSNWSWGRLTHELIHLQVPHLKVESSHWAPVLTYTLWWSWWKNYLKSQCRQ